MPPRLVAVDEQHVLLLDKPIVLIGRHSECDVQLESRKVSRRHCCIAQVNDHLVVRDLESTNGIRVNGKQVNEGRLQAGDELVIGNLCFKVSWDDVPAGHASPAPRPSPVPPRPATPAPHVSPSPPKPAKKPISAAPMDSPVSLENLVSCDMPVPIREPEPRGPRSELKGPPPGKKAEAEEDEAARETSGSGKRRPERGSDRSLDDSSSEEEIPKP